MCVIINAQTKEYFRFHNDKNGLYNFYKEHSKDLWIGYNIRRYDKPIMQSIFAGFNPVLVSNWIIVEEKPGWMFSDVMSTFPLIIYDTQIDRNKSLKTLEANLGLSIEETSVDFNLDRPLTKEEIKSTFDYCTHDVESTISTFVKYKPEFDTYKILIKKFNLPIKCLGKTKAQLVAEILGAVKIKRDDEWELQIAPTIILNNPEYIKVKDWMLNPENQWLKRYKGKNKNPTSNEGISIPVGNLLTTFAWGGVHSGEKQYEEEGLFLIMDVTADYPSIMLTYDLQSRNIYDKTKLANIKIERKQFKHPPKDTEEAVKLEMKRTSDALKVCMNGSFGATNDPDNNLYDPRQGHSVCVNGQLLLLDLAEKIEPHCKIIQLNTDGIIIKVRNKYKMKVCKLIAEEWVNRTKMELEYETFDKLIQKDVNNYIMIENKKSIDKHGKTIVDPIPIKRKGGWVKEGSPLDYNLQVVKEGIVAYLVKGIEPEEFIKGYTQLIDYQIIGTKGSSYDYVEHNGIAYNHNFKTFRIFASKNPKDGSIYKVSKDGTKKDKMGNTPSNSIIYNQDIRGKSVKDLPDIDLNYYVKLIRSRANRFVLDIGKDDSNE